MNPLRLIILAGLFYIAWRLLRNLIREKIRNELLRQEKQSVTQDVLEEDLICGTLIPRRQAVRLRHGGKTYYFCSDACCDTFISKKEGAKE
jgi:YHS domain-containing protein